MHTDKKLDDAIQKLDGFRRAMLESLSLTVYPSLVQLRATMEWMRRSIGER
jgi:hypothetical protein